MQTASGEKTSAKTASPDRTAPRKRAVTWGEALRVLQWLETRERILNAVKGAGFPAESWGSRSSLEALADALTRAEDWLEYQKGSNRERERRVLRELRRRLERELWP